MWQGRWHVEPMFWLCTYLRCILKTRTLVLRWYRVPKVKGMTLLEFQSKFHDEQSCREHLFRFRWGNGFSCPRCHGDR
ncbi:MAG: transposase, partial [Alicyclobacillus shizuokensis]|nr:transposase [Alicyclobacillus shizuokensis]